MRVYVCVGIKRMERCHEKKIKSKGGRVHVMNKGIMTTMEKGIRFSRKGEREGRREEIYVHRSERN